MDPKVRAATERFNKALADAQERVAEFDALVLKEDATDEQRTAAEQAATEACDARDKAAFDLDREKRFADQRAAVPHELPPTEGEERRFAEPKSRATDRADLPYSKDSQHSFYRDLIRAKNSPSSDAWERLEKNNRHRVDTAEAQQRAGLTQAAGAGGEFIYPVWLDEYVPLLRAGRVFANLCGPRPLPPNTNSINVPKITTGASVAVQSDAASVSNTDLVTTSVTAQVQTFAGRTVAAYQDIDLGAGYIDQMIHDDLMADYDRDEDSTLLNGSVSNAKGLFNVSGTNAVTYTDASPTGPELYSPLFQARSQISKLAFVDADAIVMHPSTWNWYLSQLDGSNLPLAVFSGSNNFNRTGTFQNVGQGASGQIAGIPVYVDANVPVNLGAGTNQAPIAMLNSKNLYLYESVPSFKVADQTSIANLQYQFVLYGYAAWAFGRLPAMVSIINGTGLIVQSGF